jgi:hypothetical protein
MQRGVCVVEGCGKPHKARGWCNSHYGRFKRGVEVNVELERRDRSKPERCIEEGCESPVKAKGLCQKHYQTLLRYGFIKRPNRKKSLRQCCITGCEGTVYSQDRCHAHYMKLRVYKEHGLTEADYSQLLEQQNGHCKICQKPETATSGRSTKVKDLAIDHDHKTGKVRGLLCSNCNRALGLFKDDLSNLQSALLYLSSNLGESNVPD